MDEKLQEIIDFLESGESWNQKELIENYCSEIKDLKDNWIDEIELIRYDESLMNLDEFTDAFFRKTIQGVCNVIESFRGKIESEGENENN